MKKLNEEHTQLVIAKLLNLPVCPKNPGSMMRLFPGVCYVANEVAAPGKYDHDEDWLDEEIEKIRKQEEG